MNLAVMLPLWVEKAWEAAQSFSNDLFTSNEMDQRYRTPIFSKMVSFYLTSPLLCLTAGTLESQHFFMR